MSPNKAEMDFLLSHVNNESVVLEWGSGRSTIELAKRCKQLLSIEHDKEWYGNVHNSLLHNNLRNARIILAEQNLPMKDPFADGTFTEFRNYCLFPIVYFSDPQNDLPNVAFVDGRARKYCACIALYFCSDIFIHDFNTGCPSRESYKDVLDLANVVDYVGTMYHLQPKK